MCFVSFQIHPPLAGALVHYGYPQHPPPHTHTALTFHYGLTVPCGDEIQLRPTFLSSPWPHCAPVGVLPHPASRLRLQLTLSKPADTHKEHSLSEPPPELYSYIQRTNKVDLQVVDTLLLNRCFILWFLMPLLGSKFIKMSALLSMYVIFLNLMEVEVEKHKQWKSWHPMEGEGGVHCLTVS